MAFGDARTGRLPDSRSLAARLAARGEERFASNPRPVGEVVASLSSQQQKLQGLEKKLRRLQHRSPSPRSRSSALRSAAPDFNRANAMLSMDAVNLNGGEQGNLAAFLESVSSRIDALDQKLRNMAEPAPASDPRIEVYRDTDAPWLSRGPLSRSVRRASSADNFGTRRLLARPERMFTDALLADQRALHPAQPAAPSDLLGAEATIQQLAAAATAAAEAARALSRWSPANGNQLSQAPQEFAPPTSERGSRSGSIIETPGGGRANDVRPIIQNGASTNAVMVYPPQLMPSSMSSNAPPLQHVGEHQRWPPSPRQAYSATADGFSQNVHVTPTFASAPSSGGHAPHSQREFLHFSQPSSWDRSSRPSAATSFTSMGPMTSSGPPAPLGARSNRGAPNGMFVFDQAEGQAFRELGEKAPQPKDSIVHVYQEGASPTGAAPMFPMNPAAEVGDASLPFQQAPGQSGFHSAPMTMLAASNGTGRPLSAGPTIRRHGAVYQGAPGPLGLEFRERERENLPQGEQLYRPPSSWSSRPPTWYDGASDASLSARGPNSMLQSVQLGGGMFGASNEGFNAAIWRPADRVDSFPTESFLDKVK